MAWTIVRAEAFELLAMSCKQIRELGMFCRLRESRWERDLDHVVVYGWTTLRARQDRGDVDPLQKRRVQSLEIRVDGFFGQRHLLQRIS